MLTKSQVLEQQSVLRCALFDLNTQLSRRAHAANTSHDPSVTEAVIDISKLVDRRHGELCDSLLDEHSMVVQFEEAPWYVK